MTTAFLAQAFRDSELERLVLKHWGDDVGSWSEYMSGYDSEWWFGRACKSEYKREDVDEWARDYAVPVDLHRMVYSMTDSAEGASGDLIEDAMNAAANWEGGAQAMYA